MYRNKTQISFIKIKTVCENKITPLVVLYILPILSFHFPKIIKKKKKTAPPEQQKLHVSYETKGRRGKQVTLITGFKGKTEDLESLAKKIKIHCGTGGSVKKKEIIIQGNFLDIIKTFLKKENYSVK